MSELALIRSAQAGDNRAADTLIRQYEWLTRHLAREVYAFGSDYDDLLQEARLGILAAIRTHDPARSPFGALATLAIRRRLITLVKTTNRAKRGPLSHAIRHVTDDNGDEIPITDLLEAPGGDPLDVLIRREELDTLLERFDRLTPLERHSIVGVVNGVSYRDLDAAWGGVDQVDNAVQRARQKLAA